eukprot:6193087-Prymnesium_polylepis.2
MFIVGESDATISFAVESQPTVLVTVAQGAPRVNMVNVRLLGSLRVRGGHLTLSACHIQPRRGLP